MKINHIALRNFRNLSSVEISPGRGLNFFIGRNGQGKTSILEAISFASMLRSFRDASPRHLISHGKPSGEVQLQLASDAQEAIGQEPWVTELKVDFFYKPLGEFDSEPKATKLASINGKASQSSGHYFSQRFKSPYLGVHSVVFNPADHDLVRGEPAQRRSYLDKALCALDFDYLKLSQDYSRILGQRNSLLKTPDLARFGMLEAFTEQLALLGAKIYLARRVWLAQIGEELLPILKKIAPDQTLVTLKYESAWAPDCSLEVEESRNLERLRSAFLDAVTESKDQELHCGYTRVGPQRDDWVLDLGDQPIRGHGSQGEVRATLLALKIAELSHFRKWSGQTPLFLLDDFSSELDFERRNYLLTYLEDSDLQTFVTTTDQPSFKGDLFRVSAGMVVQESKTG